MKEQRFFEVTITEQYIEKKLDSVFASSHEEVAQKQEYKSKRVYNSRFRDIEKTGKYYRITEQRKGGKAFIFEIIN